MKCKLFTTLCLIFATCWTSSIAASDRQNDHNQESLMDRQWGDSSVFVPNMFLTTLMPLSILVGIGIILVKLFILGLWIYGRSGTGYGGYGPVYPGYGAYTTAYSSNAWRGDSSASARSMMDSNGLPIPSYIGSKILSLVNKVSEALEKMDKKHS